MVVEREAMLLRRRGYDVTACGPPMMAGVTWRSPGDDTHDP